MRDIVFYTNADSIRGGTLNPKDWFPHTCLSKDLPKPQKPMVVKKSKGVAFCGPNPNSFVQKYLEDCERNCKY